MGRLIRFQPSLRLSVERVVGPPAGGADRVSQRRRYFLKTIGSAFYFCSPAILSGLFYAGLCN